MFKHALIALATTAALATPALAQNLTLPADANPNARPAIIAETVTALKSLRPSLSAAPGAASSTEIEIAKAGAVFVKVHFSYFNIPEGAYVTVSDVSGNEVYMYDGKDNKKMTFDRASGENGQTRFSAMSVFGEKAIVRLVVPEGAVWGSEHGVKIDKFQAGNENSDPVFDGITAQETFSTCGVNERVDAVCWQNSHPTEYERTRPVARLLMGGSGLCTGWRVGNDNHMFTNNHCVEDASTLQNTEVWFNYQKTTCGGSTFAGTVKVTGAQLLKTDYNLDYTLFTVNNFANIQSFGNFGLDIGTPQQGQRIYIPQHGSGNPKEMSIESDQNASGWCEIDVAIEDGRATNTDTGYMCDTIGGSSGSPVLATDTNKVIALHHFGGCTNQGVRMDLIWPQVSSHFGGTVPDGDGGPIGPQPPVAQISENCNGLSCTFDGSGSSDADGNITSYAWTLGDGTNGSGSSVNHTYTVNGNYDVTLTVTDNDGQTGTATVSVAVNDGSGFVLQDGVPVTGLAESAGNDVVYTIDTVENNTTTTVTMSGGTGDADLYVRAGAAPSDSTYDCRPYAAGNNETCTVVSATPEKIYARVKAYSTFSGVSLVADLSTSTPPGGDNFPMTNLSGSNKEMAIYTYTGSGTVTVTMSGGTGDADLYTRLNADPTTTSYDCRPYKYGNAESCTATLNAGDELKIGVRAYSDYTGVTLDVQ